MVSADQETVGNFLRYTSREANILAEAAHHPKPSLMSELIPLIPALFTTFPLLGFATLEAA
jgi:hypothetical protein